MQRKTRMKTRTERTKIMIDTTEVYTVAVAARFQSGANRGVTRAPREAAEYTIT
jgi:hypothetical protein